MATYRRTRLGVAAMAAGAVLALGLRPAAAQATFDSAVPAGHFVEPLESQGVVEQAPYSAEIVTESTQMLADGNRISHRASARVARDSRGRERREHEGQFFIGGLAAQNRQTLVTITDPVSDTAVTLDTERQVATRLLLRPRAATAIAAAGATVAMSVQAVPAQRGDRSGPVSTTGGFQWSAATAASPTTVSFGPEASTNGHTESLGTQIIEGVKAEGLRTTVTLPAGSIGNDLPIVIVSERWYSPELQTVLTSRRSDPRFGETVFRLVNLVRAEPPADLFEIPAGYEIEEPGPPKRTRP